MDQHFRDAAEGGDWDVASDVISSLMESINILIINLFTHGSAEEYLGIDSPDACDSYASMIRVKLRMARLHSAAESLACLFADDDFPGTVGVIRIDGFTDSLLIRKLQENVEMLLESIPVSKEVLRWYYDRYSLPVHSCLLD